MPVSVLLGEQTTTHEGPPELVLDLEALNRVPRQRPVQRFVRSIILERGDYNGRVLTIRRDDLRAICALLQTDIAPGRSPGSKPGVLRPRRPQPLS